MTFEPSDPDYVNKGGKLLMEKPLFIPLKREYFEAFERGDKDTEYRLPGGKWNDRTCQVGRKAVLSLGYGKKRRLEAVVKGYHEGPMQGLAYAAFVACYPGKPNMASHIRLEVSRAKAAQGGGE